ncbi:putative dipeptidase [Annulohypoxylon maeteangense]|uniref:putative dipeptidase n=1 Tax=Annulohypoxylon maeteangense TaxID=1927788 RepID=UPI002007D142|nr:putative dipeptidase [Annulohypoxylon maeteangense]KAI0885251.1 putative dipeptidase [Annulohypoxylon maeteangense]
MDEKAVLGVDDAAPVRSRPSFARKAILIATSLLVIGTLLHPTSRCHHPLSKAYDHFSPKSVEQRVQKILSETPLIDGHNDFAILIRFMYNNHIYDEKFTKPFEEGGFPMHVDLPRLREGQNGGAFWSVYTPCPTNGSDWSDENYASSVQLTLQQIDLMTRLQTAYPNDFSGIPTDSKSAVEAFKKDKFVSPLGIEGLHQIGNSVANLRRYYALGVRYATLTHNCGNKFADAALWENPFAKAPPVWGGLSPKGKQLVNEMNRIGMIVDLSHVSVDTMRDVLGGSEGWAGSKAPIMFSHSSAFSICPHPRNVPDDILQLVKEKNSIVMVNFSPDFISCVDKGAENGVPEFFPENNTLSQVVDHIEYIGNLIGYDHVGLGSDFDGIPSTPEGLADVSKYPDLMAELLRRGISDEDAGKIAGGNVLRVWGDVEKVAAKLQSGGEPVLEDDLEDLFGVDVYFSGISD